MSTPSNPRAERAKRRSEGLTAAGRPLAEELQNRHRSTPEQNQAARTRILELMAEDRNKYEPHIALSVYAEHVTLSMCNAFETWHERCIESRKAVFSLQMLKVIEEFPGWRNRDRGWKNQYPDFPTRIQKLREMIGQWIAEERWREIELLREKMLKVRDWFEAGGVEGIVEAEDVEGIVKAEEA